jgi:hypothetical protein
MLSAVGGFSALAVKTRDGLQVKDGKFLVMSEDPRSSQSFNWEVKAVRRDVPALEVEVEKSSVEVGGDGPYTYIRRKIR